MDKNTTPREMSILDAVFQLFAVAMDSYTSAYVLCGVLAVVVYKIISLYVRKSIEAKGTAVKGEDNEEENGSAAIDDDKVSKKAEQTSANLSTNNCIGDKLNGKMDVDVIPAGKEELQKKCQLCELTADSEGSNSVHATAKGESFLEQIQIVSLLQGGVTADTLDTLQPPIDVCEWFTCPYQCANTTYDLKVTLQDENKMPIVEFYYGYDFSKSPKGKYMKVSHTFKKYGPGIRYITFRHKIGSNVKINDGEYGCKMTDGIITVSRNKTT